jgi:hypothetical protein
VYKEGVFSLMKLMEIHKNFHQLGSLCVYHFGDKIVNSYYMMENSDLILNRKLHVL